MHVKHPVVHVRVRWIMETQKDPACTLIISYKLGLDSVTLLQLAFLGESNPHFPWEKFSLGQQSVKNNNNNTVQPLLREVIATNTYSQTVQIKYSTSSSR